jgi:hypothetical protein
MARTSVQVAIEGAPEIRVRGRLLLRLIRCLPSRLTAANPADQDPNPGFPALRAGIQDRDFQKTQMIGMLKEAQSVEGFKYEVT